MGFNAQMGQWTLDEAQEMFTYSNRQEGRDMGNFKPVGKKWDTPQVL